MARHVVNPWSSQKDLVPENRQVGPAMGYIMTVRTASGNVSGVVVF